MAFKYEGEVNAKTTSFSERELSTSRQLPWIIFPFPTGNSLNIGISSYYIKISFSKIRTTRGGQVS